MKNRTEGKDQAFPISNNVHVEEGLTKREYFAAMAMQGVEASNFLYLNGDADDGNEDDGDEEILFPQEVASRAVAIADALIAELNKEKES